MIFYRMEHRERYNRGRAMKLPIRAFGKSLDQFASNQGLYDKVLNEAAKSDEPLARIVERVAHSESKRAAFVGGSAAFWAHLCETVRLSFFSDRPSRLTCVFALREAEDADKFAEVFEGESARLPGGRPWRRWDQVVYKVACDRPQDDRVYDMALIDSLDGSMTHRQAVDLLRAYWQGDRSHAPLPECLLVGATYRGEIVRTFT